MSASDTIKALPPKAKARLRRYECGWCGQRLDRECAAIGERCSDEKRLDRIGACLSESRIPAVVDEGERIRGETLGRALAAVAAQIIAGSEPLGGEFEAVWDSIAGELYEP